MGQTGLMHRLETMDDLQVAVERLIAAEPRFAAVVERHGLPPLRPARPGLESLLRIVTDQLISLKAGAAIWTRLAARLEGFEPATVLAASQDELRALGLSGAKARTFHAAALAFAEAGAFNADNMSDDEFQRWLMAIPGVGPWTASIYLLMALRSADAWPASDLALQIAAQDLLALGEKPSSHLMAGLAEGWRPQRAAAALLLWRHYRALRGMPAG